MQISYHQQSIQTWTALLAPIKTATLATTTTSSSSSHYAAHPSHSLSEVANGKPHTHLLQAPTTTTTTTTTTPKRGPAPGNLNLKNGFGTSVNGHHNSDHSNNTNMPNTQVQQQSTQTINNQLVNKAGEYNKQLNPNTNTTNTNNNNNNNSNTTIDLLSADFPFYDGAESSFFQSPATTRAGAPPTSTGHNYDPYTDNDNNTLIMTSNDSYADITSYINDISNTNNTTTTNNTNTNNNNNNNNNKGANKKDKGRNKKSGSVSDFTDA